MCVVWPSSGAERLAHAVLPAFTFSFRPAAFSGDAKAMPIAGRGRIWESVGGSDLRADRGANSPKETIAIAECGVNAAVGYGSELAVDVPAMADLHDAHQDSLVFDVNDDAVVADAIAP